MCCNYISLFVVFIVANMSASTLRADESGSIIVWGDNTWSQYNVPQPNTDFTEVAAGNWHSLGLKSDGSIVVWGGSIFDLSARTIPPPNTGFVAIAAYAGHSLGLKADGSIVTWGERWSSWGFGPVLPTPNTGFVAIAPGFQHCLGLKADGSIVAWGGFNFGGELNVPPPNTGFVEIAAGEFHNLGLKSDGSIVAWGNFNLWGELNVPEPNTNFVAVAAGQSHSLGLKDDGSIVAWGSNNHGECDVPSPNTGFVEIAAGPNHNLGLKADGSIVAWGGGDNRQGQCDVPSPNTGFVAIAAGAVHSLGIKGQFATADIPELILPLDGADVSTAPVFQVLGWSAEDLLQYKIEILQNEMVVKTFDQSQDTINWDKIYYLSDETATFTLPESQPLEMQTYQWRAYAFDGVNWSRASLTRSFTVSIPSMWGCVSSRLTREPIEGVSVELINRERLYTVDTNYRGIYEMFGLEPGIYDIRVSAANRPSSTNANVVIPSVTAVDIPLEAEPSELAIKYAPILYLHQDENFAPTTVQLMLDHSTINGQTSRTVLAQLPMIGNDLEGELMEIELSNPDDEDYIEFYNNNREDYINSLCVYAREEFFPPENPEYFVIQYWFFYLHNPFQPIPELLYRFKHEGDWEMVQLTWLVIPSNSDDLPRPDWVTYSHHLGGTTLQVQDNDTAITWTDTHPHVYVALGSHASYFKKDMHTLTYYLWEWNISLVFEDDATNDGVILLPFQPGENSNEMQYNLVNYPYPIEGWARYRGRWGRENEENIPIIEKPKRSPSPLAPIEQVDKWTDPVGWAFKWLSE